MLVPNNVFQELGISKRLAQEFFIAFARFEYALKATGYLNTGDANATPNWDLWAKNADRRSAFANLLRDPKGEREQHARDAYDYISNAPPKKQKWDRTKKQLYWDDSCPLQGRYELQKMVDALRRIRNNLFHGGKFLTIDSSTESRTVRNRKLVRHGLALLEVMLTLDAEVSLAFYH